MDDSAPGTPPARTESPRPPSPPPPSSRTDSSAAEPLQSGLRGRDLRQVAEAMRKALDDLDAKEERILEPEQLVAAGDDGGRTQRDGGAATGPGARRPLSFVIIVNLSEAYEGLNGAGSDDSEAGRGAGGAIFLLALLHPEHRHLNEELHSILFLKAIMHLTKLDVHLARGIFKRLQAAVFELGAMGPAREKSIGGQKRSSESATKGKELDAARAVMKGLRVKNALLEAKLGEVETRASAKGEESTRLKELERTLGEERKRMRRVEEERAKTRTASEAERARLRCEVEDISRELRAKNELPVATTAANHGASPPSRSNANFVVARLAEQVKVLNAALLRKTAENTELLVRLGAGGA